ncbi:MAG: GLPGLI family protein [Muribaculaceae bacterium]|nr:GLPGLI family protein [Muribaculaceae bacterium]
MRMKLYTLLIAITVAILNCDSVMAQLSPEIMKNLKPADWPVRWGKEETLDTSINELVYYHFRYDPIADLALDSEEILQVGPKVSRYVDYGFYRLDSLNREGIEKNISMMSSEYDRITQYWPLGLKYSIYTHHDKDELEVTDKIFINNFRYSEPVPDFKWILNNDSIRQIGPYTCFMATTSFRGRDWTAWYTPEIPISLGPWKFSGLPGLIVMVRDTDGEHIFKLLRSKEAGNPILLPDRLYCRKERTEFNAAKREYEENPFKTFESMGTVAVDANGKPLPPPNPKERKLSVT